MEFEWDDAKSESNADKHSTKAEKRYFCYGKMSGKVVTVRFIFRGGKIRIFGAGYWREGNEKYNRKS